MLLPHSARASTIIQRSIEELTQQADAVARGRVTETSAQWRRGTIITRVNVEIRERWSGDPPDQITLTVPGGQIGNLRAHVAGVAHYRVGDDVVLFMARSNDDTWHSLALAWAVYHCHNNVASRATNGLSAVPTVRNPLLRAARIQAARASDSMPVARLRARVLQAAAP